MSNALKLFEKGTMQVPTHLQDLNDEGNIRERVMVNALGYEGKTWSITLKGEKTQLMKRDADGDEVPLSIMRAVILNFNARRGRSYYPGAYDPAKAAQPDCWSDDGVEPHPNVKEPQCGTCADCPMAVKGSRVSEQGKAVTACSQHRIMAVVPSFKMDMAPLRLKLAVTSDYDKENDQEADGWFAFQQYQDFLKARNINHTAMLVTKMKFDKSVAYPKVLFQPDRWVEADEQKIIGPLVKSDEVTKLLSSDFGPDGSAPAPKAPKEPDEGVENDGAAQAELAAAKKAEEEAAAKKAAAAAKRKATAEAAAKKKAEEEEAAKKASSGSATITITDEDDDDDEVPSKKATKTVDDNVEDAEVVGEVPTDVAALLADWEDD